MNPRELVDHIRIGPWALMLDEPLRFRRRTRSNPCDFNEFLQALRSSETIRTIRCESQQMLDIAEDQWALLVKTLGSIKGIQYLELYCTQGSRDFHPFQAVAEAVNSAHSLHDLRIDIYSETFPRDSSGLTALASALRERMGLREFTLIDQHSTEEAAQSTAIDPLLQALSACPHLEVAIIMTTCASADAIRNLLQLPTVTALSLGLTLDHWLAVADEIRQGRCLIKNLTLCKEQGSKSKATEAVKALASAIKEDRRLEYLELRMENGFTDEAGVALAEALTINKTLHKFIMGVKVFEDDPVHTKAYLNVQAYEALGAMLRINTSIELVIPPLDSDVGDQHDMLESITQMRIEQRLNIVGRGKLLTSSQTPREEWVDALQELNAPDDDELFEVSCLYSLLRLNPSVCLLELNDTTNSIL
jgi:hypothetical protein